MNYSFHQPSFIPNILKKFTCPPPILAIAHEAHLGILRVKQLFRSLVLWPVIERDLETLVK